MHRFNAFGRGAGQHDSESSGTHSLMSNEKKRKIRLPFSSLLFKLYRLNVKTNSDLFSIYSFKSLNSARHIFYAGRNVAVPRVTKFYEKNRSNFFFLFEKHCYKVKAFLAQDNRFIFEGIWKTKVDKRTKLYL